MKYLYALIAFAALSAYSGYLARTGGETAASLMLLTACIAAWGVVKYGPKP